MAADDGLKAEIEAELARARDVAETRSIADLREAIGAGHDDLMAAIDELRVDGKLTEVAPGEYMPFDSNTAAREARAEARQRPREEAAVEEPGISLAEAERATNGDGRYPTRGGERKTTLTQGVATALDEQSLGRLVKAGMEEAAAVGAIFVFEVLP